MTSRTAGAADVPAISRIYNAGIAERVATFETRPRQAEEIRSWLGGPHPVVVVEDDDGRVTAFAAAFAYSQRPCYSGVAEFSVYVDLASRRRGAGRLALETLAREAEAAGFWKLTGKVFADNLPSRAMLGKLGFREVGIHLKHSRLDGEWKDIVVVERLLTAVD